MAVRVEQGAEPIPGYRLLERLGGGGFGEVWRAVAPGGLHKAIKFVYGDLSGAGDQRAEQELKSLKRVQSVRHPYILSLERYDIVDGQLMIVMELADRNLWDRFKECRVQGLPGIPREELLRYLDECAEALDLMNREYQLQHLDIKPQNLFLVHQHIKVADFGLVKDLEGSQASVTGGVTPVYAAPETFEGNVTRYSDQYSLAIVFQELLTGQRPFPGNNVRQLILQHLQGVPKVSPLPAADQPHIARALSKSPHERFPTCTALVAALRGTPEPEAANPAPAADSIQGTVPYPEPGQILLPGYRATHVAGSPVQKNGSQPETGAGQSITHCLRAIDPNILKGPEAVSFRAPAEIKGPGTLFPAVVIGLGQMGLTVLQRLRETLHTCVAPLSRLPNLRFFAIDTDPEVLRTATRGQPNTHLTASDMLLAQLNRPSYYLKQRDGRCKLESWLNPRLLFRIPRSQVTTGVRALGRLAFTAHYRTILRRLQMELEVVLDPQALEAAARHTGLGIRTNRPRIYLITSLAGGTGSGMFIDMAYTARALLRQMGYQPAEVIGLLLVPPVDGSRTRVMPLGNTYAALTELNYFADPANTFQATYHEREEAISDDGPPFNRSILMPCPDESDEVGMQEMVDLCGQMLYRDLATPLGKTADLTRAGMTAPPWESRGQYFETFGLYQLVGPRPAVLQVVGRRLCQRIVQRWMSKDSKPLRQTVQSWVQEQWRQHDLGADHFIHRLQAEIVKKAGRPAETLFNEAIESLASAVSSETSRPPPKRPVEGKPADPDLVRKVLDRLQELLGTPQDDCAPETPPQLPGLLRAAADQLGAEWSQKVAELAVHLIEEPAFRLAGAEEAIRQIVATIEQVLQHHEPLTCDLARKAHDAYDRLRAYCAPPAGQRRPVFTAADVIELLRSYAKWRYQCLVLQHLATTFVGLRGHLSDQLREVNFCRVRLTELLRLVEETTAEQQLTSAWSSDSKQGSIGRCLFTPGWKDLREAVDCQLEGFTQEHLLELDTRMEEMLKSNFTALVHVCLTNANIIKSVESAMLQTAREYAADHLPPASAAQLFLDEHGIDEEDQGNIDEAENEIAGYFSEAGPELSPGRVMAASRQLAEMCILATPDDSASTALRRLVENALPDTEVHTTSSTDDIVIYRERNNLALTDLEHLGPVGHDAYMQMNAAENFTPHSRCDIDFRKRK